MTGFGKRWTRLGAAVIATLAVITLAYSHAAAPELIAAQDKGKEDKGKQDKGKEDKGGDKKPASRVGVQVNSPKAFQGYTLFSPLGSTKFYLVDMQGRVVKQWEGAATPASSAYLFANGNIMRPCVYNEKGKKGGGGPSGGRVQEFTWDGAIVWDFKTPYEWQQHHDVLKLPNGNYLILGWDRKNAEESAAAGRKGGSSVTTDVLMEVRPTGKTTGDIVWSWRIWDHLIQDVDKEKKNFGEVAKHPELIDINFGVGGMGKGGGGGQDWTHTNALSYHAELDQIMMSVPSLNEVWIIDHSTTTAEAASHKGGKSGKGGDLLYRWGNPRVYRAGTQKDQQLFFQHNTQWIPPGLPGAGHLLVFNNGRGRPGGEHSSADELVLPVDAKGHYTLKSGGAYGPEKPVWSFAAPNKKDLYSNFISGAQRLPNGNTLICEGAKGTFWEVTPEKEVVWKYINPVAGGPGGGGKGGPPGKGGPGGGGSVFRATRIAPDFAGLVGRNLTPGKTIEEMQAQPKKDAPKEGGK